MTSSNGWQWVTLCTTALLLLAPASPAQDKDAKKEDKELVKKDQPVTKEDREFARQVNEAIDKAVKYLRGLQGDDGNWPAPAVHQLGNTSLAALALLEAGVPANDPAIRKAADAVRKLSLNATYNYSVTLAIMFLDRLGDPQDEPFIESLAVRVLGTQGVRAGLDPGGWTYFTPPPDATDNQRLNKALRDRKDGEILKEARKGKRRLPSDLPKEVQEQIRKIYNGGAKAGGGGDNSNTQFALIALWAARRHGIPVEQAITLAEQRLRRMQLTTGGWPYQPGGPASPQMTCCGLIGLGLAYGLTEDDKGKKTATKDISKDRNILAGLKAVAGVIGEPATDTAKIPRIPQGRADKLYYTLWTLERMAVLYDIKKFGNKDWYKWGAQILVVNQSTDGSWQGAYHAGGCDTCFALLFLKRANLTEDLTERMKKDPSRPRLINIIEEPARKGNRAPRNPRSNPMPQQQSLARPMLLDTAQPQALWLRA